MLAALASCGQGIPPPDESGELVVLTRNGPNTYFLDQDGRPAGFEYELVRRFADAQGWRLRVELAADLGQVRQALEARRVHLAAAWLTVTPARQRELRYGPAYAEEKEWVVCRRGATGRDSGLRSVPRDLSELGALRVEVVADSSHLETLARLSGRHASLHWTPMRVAGEEELLERVANGLADCTVADEVALGLAGQYLSELVRAFDLGPARPVAWALPWRTAKGLKQRLETFFRDLAASGELERLRERHLGWRLPLAEVDRVHFMEHRVSRLSGLRGLFFQAQEETGLDWRLLAAIAYQESQWDARAVSPTGVRGIMMLTEQTADHLGVKNRLDPRESILAGARYVVELSAALPEHIREPDRVWLALAAYNLGMAHLEDARRLARAQGRDPDAWADLREVLPLLARAGHAARLRYGYARGGEARHFVDSVGVYYDMLRRLEAPYVFGFAGAGGEGAAAPVILAP